ncbi:hypothetical protein LEP1GSC058_2832 [Leptospira fainei serovar Hurstbridge str. BUT 6]|uniref:Uncharacterized protein n=1 Tax=Leptospira fainei serovar Hurstbridge str. BUT 6 TaxID=1193011 RepID=S3W1C7_9LEPT|nr:hypothetical protein LEP1GSC058_2832 [Leptospira fainei serovar Hurstbridge str. BUT 6]
MVYRLVPAFARRWVAIINVIPVLVYYIRPTVVTSFRR